MPHHTIDVIAHESLGAEDLRQLAALFDSEYLEIHVGGVPVVIAGVGGVLVAGDARGADLGIRMLRAAARPMRDADGIHFGYLRCREDVVPFYQAGGWNRIIAAERGVMADDAHVAPGGRAR